MLDRLSRSWSSPEGSVTQARGGSDGERLGKRSPMQRPEGLQLEGTEKAFLMKSLISRDHALQKL